jgi:hypothetical protein
MRTDHFTDIYDYIITQEANYRRGIPINDSWNWSMKEHIKLTELYSNSQLKNNSNREFTPVKNIIRPILNLQHRAEDIELKDVQIYINDPDKYHLSFLVKKYHDDVFAVENNLDDFFDELNVSLIDFGGCLSKKLNKPAPEVVPLQSIAFCDQTDLLSGPIGLKHYFSPDQLLEMADKGWGNPANGATITLEGLIALSREEKKTMDDSKQSAQTTGRYIEIYEVHGNLPKIFADKTDTSGKYETRIFICAFYQKKDSQEKQGVILYTAPEKKSPFKFKKRDAPSAPYGRALGMGGAEELFEAQVWTNYDVIRIQRMLDAASTIVLKATGPNSAAITQKKLRDMDNLEIIDVGEGSDLGQVDTFPRNLRLFENSMAQWEIHAKDMGAAQDPIQGKPPSSGTPFSSLIEQVRQGMSLHEYRRGQFAKHIEEIYRDWIIPHIQKKITEGFKFLSELSLDEMRYVTERLVENQANNRIKEIVLSGGMINQEEVEVFKELARAEFKKKGNKHFLEAVKNDFKDAQLAVKVSVAGKSKDLGAKTDKLVNIFRQIIANPAVLQIPAIADIFNQILESSGFSPADFTGITKEQIQTAKSQEQPVPMKIIKQRTPEMSVT